MEKYKLDINNLYNTYKKNLNIIMDNMKKHNNISSFIKKMKFLEKNKWVKICDEYKLIKKNYTIDKRNKKNIIKSFDSIIKYLDEENYKEINKCLKNIDDIFNDLTYNYYLLIKAHKNLSNQIKNIKIIIKFNNDEINLIINKLYEIYDKIITIDNEKRKLKCLKRELLF